MILCDDPQDETCEKDLENLCPPGFHLCFQPEFVALNNNWNYTVPRTQRPVGAIYCRGTSSGSSGAGHYTLGYTTSDDPIPLSNDEPLNCASGSSLPQCSTVYGCNEKAHSALWCSTNPSCGDGVVTAPLEECDDGNDSDEDDCLNTCTWRWVLGDVTCQL